MNRTFLYFLIAGCALSSCRSRQSPLIREWQAVEVYNSQFEQLMKDQQTTIDTMGSHTTAATNDTLYGTHNIDSLKVVLSASLKEYRSREQEIERHLRYSFRDDSVVVIRTLDGTDSASWYFEGADILVLDEQKLKRRGDVLRLQILHLSDTALQFRNTEGSNIITSSFRPAK